MIEHIDITAAQKDYTITPELERYIMKKIGKLDRHMKKKNRPEARADVKLKENAGKGSKKCSAEVILHTPEFKLTAQESTMNMHAAIDIVENKLQNQLKKYKEKHSDASDKRKNNGARRALGKLFKRH